MGFREEILGEIKGLRPGPRELRNLGLVFLVALGIIGGFLWWRESVAWPYFLAAAALFGLWGLLWPAGLKGIYKVWLSLAIVMGFFVSRIVLALLFYLVMTPIGLVLRLMGKDLLDRKLGDRDSYWHSRGDDSYDPKRSEKMY